MQIIPEYRYDEQEQSDAQKKCKSTGEKKVAPLQLCIPIPVSSERKDTNSKNTGGGPTTTPTTTTTQTKPDCSTGNKTETQTGGIVSSSVMKINRLLLFLLVNVIILFYKHERPFSRS